MKKKSSSQHEYPYLKFGFSLSGFFILLITIFLTALYAALGYFVLGFFMGAAEIASNLKPALVFGAGVILVLVEESWRIYDKNAITALGIPLKLLGYASALVGFYLFLKQFELNPASESLALAVDFTAVTNLLLIEAYILQHNKHVRKNEQIEI